MNLPARDALYWSVFVLLLLPLAAVLAVLISFLMPFIPLDMRPIAELPAASWWLFGKAPFPSFPTHPLWGLTAAIAVLCVALITSLRVRVLYQRIRAPELFFFLIFLFSLSTETLRGGIAVLYVLDQSVSAGIVLTRTVYWGRFLGQLALLVAGLYALDMKYRNVLALTGAVLLIAFAIASNLPLDRTVLLSSLVYKLGDEQSIRFVTIILAILTMGCGAGAFFARKNPAFLRLSAAFLLLVAGREVSFAGTGPLILCMGLAAFLGGIPLFLSAIQGIYEEGGAARTGDAAG